MKKLVQISIVIALALVLIVGLLQIGSVSDQFAGGSSCRVGWNTRTGTCLALLSYPKPPVFQPNVGWNS